MTRRTLTTLAVGDIVCLVHRSGSSRISAFTRGPVERVTKTQIIALAGRRFLSSNGKEVGTLKAHGRAARLQRFTAEIEQEVAAAKSERDAEKMCAEVATLLNRARAEDAVRLAAMIGQDLKDARP